MAVTGAIVCTPSALTMPWGATGSGQANQGGIPVVDCALTLTNGGAADVQIIACEPYAQLNGAGATSNALGVPPVSQGALTLITASGGTLVLHFGFRPDAPTFASDGLPGSYSSLTYTIGAFCQFSDGTAILVTTQTIVITAPVAP